jgi:Flp pilus assembly protein TadB
VIVQYYTEKEQQQVTELVMILSKWSLVKNDLIYCIRKACESDLKNPIKRLLHDTYIRISSGMSMEKALLQLEEDAFGDNLKYLVKNIKFSAKKGGDLSTLFKNTEEQYFKIDEELFKRKISSYRDQITIYLVMIMVLVIALWFITRDASVYAFYVKTILGQNLIGLFCVMYCGGVILTVKK